MWRDLRFRLRAIFRRRVVEAELDEELRSHIERQTQRYLEGGLSAQEAAQRVRAEFGGLDQVKETCRDARGVSLLETVLQDVGYALRIFRKTPAFSFVAVLTLAVGIGAATAAFTQVNVLFLRPVPIKDPGAVRTLSWTSPKRSFAGPYLSRSLWDERIAAGRKIEFFSYAAYRSLRERLTSFSNLACWSEGNIGVLAEGGHLAIRIVSGNYFETLGVAPALGRAITPEDDRSAARPVAMISTGVWNRVFGHDADILQRTVDIRGTLFTIVGVLPPSFAGTDPTIAYDVIIPYAALPLVSHAPVNEQSWTQGYCSVVGRLKDRTKGDAARTEAEFVLRQTILENPPATPYELPRVWLQEPTRGTNVTSIRKTAATPLMLVVATTGFILLITCTNLAGLLLATGKARQFEIATRIALGARRARIVRQLLTEYVLLAIVGGMGGLGIAYALGPLLPSVLNALIARFTIAGTAISLDVDVRPDLRVAVFAILLTLCVGIAVGILPALNATRLGVASAIRHGMGRSSARTRSFKSRALLVIQVAIASVLMVGAGLLVRTFANLERINVGYDPQALLFVTVSSQQTGPQFIEQTLHKLDRLPGVTSTAVSQWPLFNNASQKVRVCVGDNGQETDHVDWEPVTPGFFSTWKIPLLRGELFRGAERVAIVNETLAKQFFPNNSPIGHAIREGTCNGPVRQIVGVVADHLDRQRAGLTPMVYIPYNTAIPTTPLTFSLRTNANADSSIRAVRSVIADVHVDVESDVQTGRAYRARTIQQERLLALLLVFFSGVALAIACLGIYGTVAYTAASRQKEIGIRLALGANLVTVLRIVASDVLLCVTGGLLVGNVSAIVMAQLVRSLLFGVRSSDPATLAGVSGLLLVAAAVATLLPAVRACRIDPLEALRQD